MKNPVIRGFNPDPSIIRIGDTYYIAASTFQWYPGVEIYESKDLEHWRLHSTPLKLDLKGVPDGGGVWAPCLSYDGRKIYLVYTIVKERGVMMQTDNFVATAFDIDGEWSEGKYLNSMGFDPSLFHDDDGKKYLINLDNHYLNRFNGLWLTEFDEEKGLIGEPKKIYAQKEDELVEGAHIYHLNGWYYLLKAQGGTGERHSAQVSRSRSIWGEYEDDEKILLHSRDNPDLYIQCAGHADIVKTPLGWVMCHLGERRGLGICGRETCMENVCFTEDGWLRLEGGGNTPCEEFHSGLESHTYEEERYCDFKRGKIAKCFKSLREEVKTEFVPQGLKLRGGVGLTSRFDQTLLAVKIDEENFRAETKVTFSPKNEKQLAGLIMYYDSMHWHFCHLTKSAEGDQEIRVLTCEDNSLKIVVRKKYDGESVRFAAELLGEKITFYANGERLCEAPAKTISSKSVALGFTGAMAGMCVIDMYEKSREAVFEYFDWRDEDERI